MPLGAGLTTSRNVVLVARSLSGFVDLSTLVVAEAPPRRLRVLALRAGRGPNAPIVIRPSRGWATSSGSCCPVSGLRSGTSSSAFSCVTIIGIPFGVASFKLAGLALVPFGKMIVNAGAPLPPNATVFLTV
jgi:hypothetical protein